MTTTRNKILLLPLLAATLTIALIVPAPAAMTSEKIARNVCLTTGGGRFVDLPAFPGERIDRRLLADIKYLQRRYKIFVTDGLSTDPVHAANGEHPIGLAIDVVPDTAAGGTWQDVDALAKLAEPTQDHPAAPFRWVGYTGDENHGRGNHLHLSWNHSETKPGVPAASVYTLRCPTAQAGVPPATGSQGGSAVGHGGGGKHDGVGDDGSTGGVDPVDGGSVTSSGGTGVGRIRAELRSLARDPVVETGGVGLG